MAFFDTLARITPDEWRIIVGIGAGTATLGGLVGHAVGRAKSWNDRRRDRDRDNMNVVRFILKKSPGGAIVFDVETDDDLPELHKVFANPALEKHVRDILPRHHAGDRLFEPGKTHYVAMERAGYFLSGPSADASQAAMAHRDEEYHEDLVAFKLTSAVGEDGIKMPHLLMASLDDLRTLRETDALQRLRPRRQVHERYIPLVRQMAEEQLSSEKLFAEQTDEIVAG